MSACARGLQLDDFKIPSKPSFSRIASKVLKKAEKMLLLAFQCRCRQCPTSVLDGTFQSQSWGLPGMREDGRAHKGISLFFFDAHTYSKKVPNSLAASNPAVAKLPIQNHMKLALR